MRRARSPVPISERPGSSSSPRADASSSMRLSTFPFRPRQSCCVRCRNDRCSRSAASGQSPWTCGSSPPPMFLSSARCGRAGFARMSTTVSTNSESPCRPSRERDDILHLANEFLPEAGVELGRPCRKISEAAAHVLLRYRWPGNVRELRNVIRRAILLASDVIEPEHLSVIPVEPSPATAATALRGEPTPAGSSLKEIAEAAATDAEQQAIRRVLQVTSGNRSEAARLLRVDYKTLHLKMKRFGIEAGEFRAS